MASLHAALCEVNALVGQRSLSDASSKRLGVVLKGCHDVLKVLEAQLAKYKSLGTNKKRMQDRMGWAMVTVGEAEIDCYHTLQCLVYQYPAWLGKPVLRLVWAWIFDAGMN